MNFKKDIFEKIIIVSAVGTILYGFSGIGHMYLNRNNNPEIQSLDSLYEQKRVALTQTHQAIDSFYVEKVNAIEQLRAHNDSALEAKLDSLDACYQNDLNVISKN